MGPKDIITPRLILRPFRSAYARSLEEVIFADMEVMKGMEHNTSEARARRAFAEMWTTALSVESDCRAWREGGPGSYAIFLRDAMAGQEHGFIGIVGVYDSAVSGGAWQGEFFYALGSAWHRRGLMSEAVPETLASYRSLARSVRLWAVHWNVLNPASGRILRRAGFVEEGVRMGSEIHGRARVLTLPAFELARLAATTEAERGRVLREAAVKLGHLVAEGILERGEASKALARTLARSGAAGSGKAEIEAALDSGMRSPALRCLIWENRGVSGSS